MNAGPQERNKKGESTEAFRVYSTHLQGTMATLKKSRYKVNIRKGKNT